MDKRVILPSVNWVFLLSCLAKTQGIDRPIIWFDITQSGEFAVKIKLPSSTDNRFKNMTDDFLDRIRKGDEPDIHTSCPNYQQGYSLFEEQGIAFGEPRIKCPANSQRQQR